MKTDKIDHKDLSDKSYPGFDYQANQLSKFIAASDLFTILLKSGEIIHYSATDKNAFSNWLTNHNVEDIKIEK